MFYHFKFSLKMFVGKFFQMFDVSRKRIGASADFDRNILPSLFARLFLYRTLSGYANGFDLNKNFSRNFAFHSDPLAGFFSRRRIFYLCYLV